MSKQASEKLAKKLSAEVLRKKRDGDYVWSDNEVLNALANVVGRSVYAIGVERGKDGVDELAEEVISFIREVVASGHRQFGHLPLASLADSASIH